MRAGARAPHLAGALPQVRTQALDVDFVKMIERPLSDVTRARFTQIMNLLLLAPDIQERLLDGVLQQSITSERHLRPVIRNLDWAVQRSLFAKLSDLA